MRKIGLVLLCAVLAILLAQDSSALVSYSGSMTTRDGSAMSEGVWGARGFFVTWNITEMSDGWWRYDYTIPAPPLLVAPELGDMPNTTFALELSTPGYTGLFRNVSTLGFSMGSYDPGMTGMGMSNALLFEHNSGRIIFETKYAPTWGDFYTVQGDAYRDPFTGQLGDNKGWNSGYSLGGELGAPPADGAFSNKLLLPDSTTAIPEPGTMLLFGLGLAGAGVYRRVTNRTR